MKGKNSCYDQRLAKGKNILASVTSEEDDCVDSKEHDCVECEEDDCDKSREDDCMIREG